MKFRISLSISAAAVLAAAAFPFATHAQEDAAQILAEDTRITVEVDNGNWLDMKIYAVRENGARDRIGTVSSFSSRKLELPRWLTAPHVQIQLIAVPIGANRRYWSPPVLVSEGDVIEWNLENNLSLSSIFVRAG